MDLPSRSGNGAKPFVSPGSTRLLSSALRVVRKNDVKPVSYAPPAVSMVYALRATAVVVTINAAP